VPEEEEILPEGVVAKPKATPKKKMKALFWTKVKGSSMENTVWMTLNDTKLDTADLENDFFDLAKEQAAEKKRNGGKDVVVAAVEGVKVKEKPKFITLLDARRNQSVCIALARFKMTPSEMRRKFINFDPTFTCAENTQKLSIIIPEAEEIVIMKDYDGDIGMLGKAEKYYVELIKIPRLKQRMECSAITQTFYDSLKDMQGKVEQFNDAAEQVKSSAMLLGVLEVVMSIGNHMNGATNRGQAHGFQLDVLSKIAQVKSSDRKKGTLMNFLVKQVAKHKKRCFEFPTELTTVPKVCEISLIQFDNDFKALEASVKFVRKELESGIGKASEAAFDGDSRDDPVINFREHMEPFLLHAEEEVATFSESVAEMRAMIVENIEMFGGKANKIEGSHDFDADKASAFYLEISRFMLAYKRAKQENRDAEKRAELILKRERERIKKLALKAAGNRTSMANGGGDLFAAFKKNQEKDTEDIVEHIQLRLAAKKVITLNKEESLRVIKEELRRKQSLSEED
jgi:diaphanous 1